MIPDPNHTDKLKEKQEKINIKENAAIYNRGLIEASLDPLVAIGLDGKITDVNRATEEATGRTRRELVGTDFSKYFTDPGAACEGYQRVFRDGIVRDYPLEIRHRDGRTMFVLYNATVYKDDETGKVLGIFAAARDITEKKRAEENIRILEEQRTAELALANKNLEKSQEELELIIDSIQGLVFYKDTKNNFLRVNKYVADAYHLTKDELKNKSVFDLHTKDQAQCYFDDDLAVINSKKPRLHIEEMWVTESGTKWVLTDKIPYIDINGEVKGIIGISLDITDRKKIELEINRQRMFLRQVVDTVPAFICVKTEAGPYELANTSLARAYGTDVAGVEGKTDYDFSPTSGEADAFRRDDLDVIRGKKTKIINEERITYADGTVHWFSTTKTPLIKPDGTCSKLLVVAMDITELRDHREHLKELVDQRTADLKESQTRLLEAQTVAHLGNWEWDAIKDKITGSVEFYRLFDVPSEKIANFSQFINHLHPDDRERVQQSIANALKNGKAYETDYRVKLSNGEWRDLNARGKVFLNDLGNPIRMVGTCLDITERKKTEKQYREIFENVQIAMFRSKLDGSGVVEANPKLLEITGYSSQEMRSSPSAINYANPEKRNELVNLMKHGPIKDFEFDLLTKSGVIKTCLLSCKIHPEEGIIDGTLVDITEAKHAREKIKQQNEDLERAYEKLRESETMYKNLFENAQFGIYRSKLDGSAVLAVNPKLLEIIGISREEMIGNPAIIRWAEPEKRTEYRNSLLKDGFVKDYEMKFLTKNGDVRTGLLSAKPYSDYVEGSLIDITERKHAELEMKRLNAELSASESRYRNMYENAQVGMYRAKLDGSAILIANSMLAEITGYSLEELLLAPSAIHWAEQELRNEYKRLLIRDHQVRNFETKVIQKSGEIRTVLLSAILYPEFGYIEGTAADITERKRMEEELRLKDFVFKSSLTADSIGNNEGILTDVNQSFVKTWGYDSAEEVIGKPISDFLADQSKTAEIVNALKDQVANKETDYTETDIKMLETISNIVSPILIARVQRDREEKSRKIAEDKLVEAVKNLERSNKDLEQFAYVASHDLQEPLRMVSSYVKLLERRYKGKLDADADDFINFAVDGAVRMQNLINDLLLFSRVHTRGKEFELTDYEDVFTIAITNLQAQIESNKAIITHDPLPKVFVDRIQHIQVLQNLISNGIKFHRDETPRVHVSAKEENDEWVFSVKDNGIGIEPQYFDRVFMIFHRLNEKDKYPGTGIGLSICKRILERHGGRVWIEYEPGKGSTFLFTIPKNVKKKDEKNEETLHEFK